MEWGMYWFYFEQMATPYLLAAAAAFVVLYGVLRHQLSSRKIQGKFPQRDDYFRELGYSMSTLVIFAFIMLIFVGYAPVREKTTFYTEIAEYGWVYFFLAFPLMLLIHDAYFYWAHRLMHTKKLFRLFHRVHHQSSNPSPFAAYSFHPLEALVEGAVPIIFLFLLPMHPLHLTIFYVLSVLYNVVGHLGYELYPKDFSRTWLGQWNNTSTYHNYHHKYFQGNYGFYFLFWDRLMGTFRKT